MRRRCYSAREILEAVGLARSGRLQLSNVALGGHHSTDEPEGTPDAARAVRHWDRFADQHGHTCREWAPVVYWGLKWPKSSLRDPGEPRMRWLVRLGAAGWLGTSDADLPREVCRWLEGELGEWLVAHPLEHPREVEAA